MKTITEYEEITFTIGKEEYMVDFTYYPDERSGWDSPSYNPYVELDSVNSLNGLSISKPDEMELERLALEYVKEESF